ncbi:MAG: tRNA (adenosine(37)-N6)-threonylcarbamoyltransferase complex ATPase subunit type 1 TsaE [Acidimicrobiales bacterium]
MTGPDGSVIELASTSPEQTRALGSALATLVEPGDLLLCSGELGAGKTVLAQGLARGLGVPDPVVSPTFVLVRSHAGGRLPFQHADVWRLDQLAEVADLGLGELLEDGSVVLVEWGDRAAPVLGPDYLELAMEAGPGEDERRLRLRPVGPRWDARAARLARVVSPWAAPGWRRP